MAGGEHADSGRVARARGRRIWLHEQTPELTRDRPVREYLMEAFAELLDLEAALRAAEQTPGRPRRAQPGPRRRDEGLPAAPAPLRARRRLSLPHRSRGRARRPGAARRAARPPVAVDLRRRADPRDAGPRPAGRRRPAAAGRADQPPRHRLRGVARAVPPRLPQGLRAGHPRPPPAGARGLARAGARARRGGHHRRRLLDLHARALRRQRDGRPPLRAGQGEDRAAPALLRPLPRQEAQGQAGQGQAHPDRAHQARHEGAASATRAGCTWACRSRRPRRASCSR